MKRTTALAILLTILPLRSPEVGQEHKRSSAQSQQAVVVFTGSSRRVEHGLHVLTQLSAGRLLISGFDPSSVEDAAELKLVSAKGYEKLIRCCTDYDAVARNTVENARETAKWARQQGIRRLALVTADYHMARALLELRCAMPEADIEPHPLITGALQPETMRLPHAVQRAVSNERWKYPMAWLRTRIGCF